MYCALKELLEILPQWIRNQLQAQEVIQELRLRVGAEPERIAGGQPKFLQGTVRPEDLQAIVNVASRYSPWNASTAAHGYITAPGGHRIGLCGEAVVREGKVTHIRNLTSVCIRVAADYPGIAGNLGNIDRSLLILGPPGSGKTTLLRDTARKIAGKQTVAVVDERGELFPEGFPRGKRMDVLQLAPKPQGMEMALRTMGPEWIAVDEITGQDDCEGLLRCANCGVHLLATAHGASVSDLQKRKIYRTLLEAEIFENIVILGPDKSWTWERKHAWN